MAERPPSQKSHSYRYCLPIKPGSSLSSHICSTESYLLTIFLQKMRLLWLLFRRGVHGQELAAEGFLHNSRWYHLLRKHFGTHHNLTSTTTPISTLQRGLRKNLVNSYYSLFAKYLMCICNQPSTDYIVA